MTEKLRSSTLKLENFERSIFAKTRSFGNKSRSIGNDVFSRYCCVFVVSKTFLTFYTTHIYEYLDATDEHNRIAAYGRKSTYLQRTLHHIFACQVVLLTDSAVSLFTSYVCSMYV